MPRPGTIRPCAGIRIRSRSPRNRGNTVELSPAAAEDAAFFLIKDGEGGSMGAVVMAISLAGE